MTPITNRRILFSALLASVLAAPAIACSSGDETNDVSDDGQPDASAPDAPAIPNDAEDASAPDGDASIDAAVPAPRTCSEDAVCHTPLPPNSFLRDVWSAGDGVVWAVGWKHRLHTDAEGVILRWDGTAWTEHSTTPSRLNAVWGSSPTDIWVGGDGGLFHGTGASSAAIAWTKVRSEPILSIWGSSANDVWAVGHAQYSFDGRVFHYGGGGDGWEIDPISSRPAAYRKVWGTSGSDVWLGANEFSTCGYSHCNGTRAFALHRAPDGTWSEDGLPDFIGLGHGGGINPGSEFSGGGSITEGSVWMMGSRAPTTYEYPTWGPVTDVLFVGTRKPDGSGYTWSDTTFGTCIGYDCKGVWFNRAVWGKTPNDVYLAGDQGRLRHWNGTSFSYVKTKLEKLPFMASFYAMWGSSSTDLWIVGDEVALHKVDSDGSKL